MGVCTDPRNICREVEMQSFEIDRMISNLSEESALDDLDEASDQLLDVIANLTKQHGYMQGAREILRQKHYMVHRKHVAASLRGAVGLEEARAILKKIDSEEGWAGNGW